VSLIRLIDRIVVFSQEATVQNDQLLNNHGLDLGITIGDPASKAYMVEAKHVSTPLVVYLDTLPILTLKKLVTLMYAGRDVEQFKEARSLSAFHQELKLVGVHDSEKNEYIRILSEKIQALKTYFSSAVEVSENMGIDIEKDLASVD